MNDTLSFLLILEISCFSTGKHLFHRDLDYLPARQHAITKAMSDLILTVGRYINDYIHIYTPEGDHVGTLDHGLPHEKGIHGIQCSSDGLLHVLVGGDFTVTDLYVYRVSSSITCLSIIMLRVPL